MKDILDKFENLLGESGFEMKLRLAKGIDEEMVPEIYKTLELIVAECKKSDYIPKKAASLFVDFYPSMENISSFYSPEESIKIMNIADKIMDLIRECVN